MTNLPPNDCPFCSMAPERIRERDELAFVVDDGFPVSPGHTLILSCRHVASYFDLTEMEVLAMMRLLGRAQARLDEGLRPSGYNIGFNVGEAAGQTVMHVHLHVIPRFEGDTADPTGGIRNVIPGRGRYG